MAKFLIFAALAVALIVALSWSLQAGERRRARRAEQGGDEVPPALADQRRDRSESGTDTDRSTEVTHESSGDGGDGGGD